MTSQPQQFQFPPRKTFTEIEEVGNAVENGLIEKDSLPDDVYFSPEKPSAPNESPVHNGGSGGSSLSINSCPEESFRHLSISDSDEKSQRGSYSCDESRPYRQERAEPLSHRHYSSGSDRQGTSGHFDATVPDIPNPESIERYRENVKKSDDPAVQLDFAKYVISIAPAVASRETNPKDAKKKRDMLTSEGLKIVKRLAAQGLGIGRQSYADAQFFLAECYGNGSLGLGVNHDKAFSLYVQASKQNHPSATYRAAVCYEVGAGTRKDPNRALQFFRKAAALKNTAAMYKLGVILMNGYLNAQKNVREGITWLKRAAADADEKNPHALHELGLLHEKPVDSNIIPDEQYALELFTKAGMLGYAPSQFKLGYCYEYGLLTCPVDPLRSIAWYSKAAEQGDPEAELALSGWYLTGSEGTLKQSDTEAYLWARRSADKGLAKAEYAVGYYSEVGIGVPKNLDEARRWFMRAATQGNKKAIQKLNDLKSIGGGKKEKISRAGGNNSDCIIS